MRLPFLHSIGVKCNQDISFGILRRCASLRDLVLHQTDWFPIMKVSLNLVGLGFYTCFHVPFFSPLWRREKITGRCAASKSMLLPCWIVFLQVQILFILMVLLGFVLLGWLNLIEWYLCHEFEQTSTFKQVCSIKNEFSILLIYSSCICIHKVWLNIFADLLHVWTICIASFGLGRVAWLTGKVKQVLNQLYPYSRTKRNGVVCLFFQRWAPVWQWILNVRLCEYCKYPVKEVGIGSWRDHDANSVMTFRNTSNGRKKC